MESTQWQSVSRAATLWGAIGGGILAMATPFLFASGGHLFFLLLVIGAVEVACGAVANAALVLSRRFRELPAVRRWMVVCASATVLTLACDGAMTRGFWLRDPAALAFLVFSLLLVSMIVDRLGPPAGTP